MFKIVNTKLQINKKCKVLKKSERLEILGNIDFKNEMLKNVYKKDIKEAKELKNGR